MWFTKESADDGLGPTWLFNNGRAKAVIVLTKSLESSIQWTMSKWWTTTNYYPRWFTASMRIDYSDWWEYNHQSSIVKMVPVSGVQCACSCCELVLSKKPDEWGRCVLYSDRHLVIWPEL